MHDPTVEESLPSFDAQKGPPLSHSRSGWLKVPSAFNSRIGPSACRTSAARGATTGGRSLPYARRLVVPGVHPSRYLRQPPSGGPAPSFQALSHKDLPGKLSLGHEQTDRTMVDFQYVFHRAHKVPIAFRRDAPTLFQPRLDFVFFSVLRRLGVDAVNYLALDQPLRQQSQCPGPGLRFPAGQRNQGFRSHPVRPKRPPFQLAAEMPPVFASSLSHWWTWKPGPSRVIDANLGEFALSPNSKTLDY